MKIDLSESHGHDGFRSRLEAEVATELDRLGIHHSYEVPWTDPHSGRTIRYLPDFMIEQDEPAETVRLPRWVECKPQQFIYDLFGSLGLERRVGTHFAEPVYVDGVDSDRLKAMHVEELWKPKALAELSGEAVLIVGAVGATNRLSVEMRPTEIVFDRSHPFVNQRGVERAAERARREAEWARQREDWERRKNAQLREQSLNRLERVRKVIAASTRSVAPKFASRCAGCNEYSDNGRAHLCRLANGSERWFRICLDCGLLA